jgi:hypothetical protein
MSKPKLKVLMERKQVLDEELDQLSHKLSHLRTQVEKLNMIPQALRITQEITDIEKEIGGLSSYGHK